MRLKLRSPTGTHVVTLSDAATISDLLQEIRSTSGLSSGELEIKSGFPPRPLDFTSHPSSTPLTSLPYKLQGEQLIVSTGSRTTLQSSGVGLTSATNQAPNPQAPATYPASTPANNASKTSSSGFNFSNPPRPRTPPLTLTRNKPAPDPSDPPTIPLPSRRGTLILRIMPDDNSCLFRALSHVCTHSLMSATELRQIIAQTILSDPLTYSAVVLEQEPEPYCEWIKMETSWGGGIELGILAKYFELEIAAIDVATGSVLRFNESAGKRVVVVYSGIHYDAVVVSPAGSLVHEGGEDECVFDKTDEEMMDAALKLGAELKKKKYFTDTSNFAIKCNICQKGLKGEKEAVSHAKETGHQDFGEY